MKHSALVPLHSLSSFILFTVREQSKRINLLISFEFISLSQDNILINIRFMFEVISTGKSSINVVKKLGYLRVKGAHHGTRIAVLSLGPSLTWQAGRTLHAYQPILFISNYL